MKPSRLQLPDWLVIGFTGHRILAHPEIVSESLRHAFNQIGLIHPRIAGICSAASGSDMLFAEEITRREYPLSLILPFPIDRFRDDFNNDLSAWNRVEKLLLDATRVETIYQMSDSRAANARSGTPNALEERNPDQTNADNAAYMDVGYRTIDRADVVIAVWDGQPARGWGGTAYAVKYAQETFKPLIIIDPDTGATINERLDHLKDFFARNHADESRPLETATITNPRAEVERYFKACNEGAKKHGPMSRKLVRISLLLFLAASTIGYAALVFHLEGWLDDLFSAGSLGCVVAGTIVMIVHAKRHDLWLRRRVDAEVCRSFLATWDIRKHGTITHQPRPPVPGLRRLFQNLRMLRQIDSKITKMPINFEETRAAYNEERVDDQIRYFVKHQKEAQRSLKHGKIIMKTLNLIALICALAVFGLSVRSGVHPVISGMLHFLALSLPLAVTAMGITLMTQEASRRSARYKEILDELQPLQRRLCACGTWDSLAQVATEVEEELLQEMIEWRSFIRFTRDVAHPE